MLAAQPLAPELADANRDFIELRSFAWSATAGEPEKLLLLISPAVALDDRFRLRGQAVVSRN